MNRRRFLQIAGATVVGATGTALGGCRRASGVTVGAFGEVSLEVDLVAGYTAVPILLGAETAVARFSGAVAGGRSAALLPGDGYLGPTFDVQQGERLRVRFKNDITRPSIVHWHGLHVPMEADGHPSLAIAPGETYTYDFEVRNRAGLYWYHPHPHAETGEQVYFGLAGTFIVRDDEERDLGLPAGDQELVMVLQDRRFDDDNRLLYVGNMMERMNGFLGDRVLVNGVFDPTVPVATTAYRIRLLNGSNSRIYKLGWSDGTPLTVIGNDGGLLQEPVVRPYITLSPAERIDLWVDFSGLEIGSEVELISLPFSVPNSMGGMMGRGMAGQGQGASGRGRMAGQSLANGDAFRLLKIRVDHRSEVRSELPSRLSTIPKASVSQALAEGDPIPVVLSMGHMAALINGASFEMTGTTARERVKLGSQRLFVIDNDWEGGGMMAMPHPVHFHGQQFQVVDRQAGPHIDPGYETLREGLVDEGWKDTVLVFPGERVSIVKRFDDFAGLFLYHCHVLEHEDLGMMRNLQVTA